MAKTKQPILKDESTIPLTKQTAGGVTGAVVGGVVAGPVGAVIGGVAGAMMGNRAAQGKSLVSPKTVQTVKKAAGGVKAKVASVKPVRKMIAKAKKALPGKSGSAGKKSSARHSK